MLKVRYKLWLENEKGASIGEGGIALLREIDDKGSIRAAARELGMSYAFAWSYIRRLEKALGCKLVVASKGGRLGGRAELTEEARRVIAMFEEAKAAVENALRKLASLEST